MLRHIVLLAFLLLSTAATAQVTEEQTLPISGPLQGAGPLLGASPLQGSSPLLGAGPLVGSGPLQGAGPLQGSDTLISVPPLQGGDVLIAPAPVMSLGSIMMNSFSYTMPYIPVFSLSDFTASAPLINISPVITQSYSPPLPIVFNPPPTVERPPPVPVILVTPSPPWQPQLPPPFYSPPRQVYASPS